jgi:hypothetical protein
LLSWQLFSIQLKDKNIPANELRPNHFQTSFVDTVALNVTYIYYSHPLSMGVHFLEKGHSHHLGTDRSSHKGM